MNYDKTYTILDTRLKENIYIQLDNLIINAEIFGKISSSYFETEGISIFTINYLSK
jgi:hypothetical protein